MARALTFLSVLAIGLVFLTVPMPSAMANIPPLTPSNAPVTEGVTDTELHLIARWEDGPLYRGDIIQAPVIYPVESKAADCTERGCHNGCTIGYGYNLGAHSPFRIRHELTPILGAERAKMFSTYGLKTGLAGVALCGSHIPVSERPHITRAESWELLRLMVRKHKDNVLRRARAENLLDSLTAGQFAVLVALDYQNPSISSQATYLWQALHANNHRRVVEIIKTGSGTRFIPGLQNRRNEEASFYLWAANRARHARRNG